MTEEEVEAAARQAYAAAPWSPGEDVEAWEDLPEHVREVWCDLARGDAGAAVD